VGGWEAAVGEAEEKGGSSPIERLSTTGESAAEAAAAEEAAPSSAAALMASRNRCARATASARLLASSGWRPSPFSDSSSEATIEMIEAWVVSSVESLVEALVCEDRSEERRKAAKSASVGAGRLPMVSM